MNQETTNIEITNTKKIINSNMSRIDTEGPTVVKEMTGTLVRALLPLCERYKVKSTIQIIHKGTRLLKLDQIITKIEIHNTIIGKNTGKNVNDLKAPPTSRSRSQTK